MITKMQEESWLRTDAANERGKRVPLFGGCIAKGLQARSVAVFGQVVLAFNVLSKLSSTKKR